MSVMVRNTVMIAVNGNVEGCLFCSCCELVDERVFAMCVNSGEFVAETRGKLEIYV